MPGVEEKAGIKSAPRTRSRFVDGDRVRRARRAIAGDRALERMTRTFRALGDPTRAKVVLALSTEELCVGDLAQLLHTTPSVISHQLRVLRDLGLVRCRRQGRSSYYSLESVLIRHLFEESLQEARRTAPRGSNQ
jgi:DNA-binding transcriptional ArsR family regulator